MAGQLRAAIAGTGFVGAVHARSARLAGARLAGVAASSEESAAAAASRLGAERSFASAEAMVEEELGGASRAFADIGSHWCDLAEFVSGHRIARLSARVATAHPERRRSDAETFARAGGDRGELQRVRTEDTAVVQFETDGGALGTVVVSQVTPGRKNRLWLEVDGSEEAIAFDQEAPELLWCGRREAATLLRRDADALSPAAARYVTLPAGHPEGYAECFDAFVAEAYGAIRTGEAIEGLPVFADGLRAARITEAVLASARAQAWVEVDVAASGPGAADGDAIVEV